MVFTRGGKAGNERMKTKNKIIGVFFAVISFNVNADCFDDAAAHHGVNPWILRGIAAVESGFNPAAMNRNANGSIDIGFTQINSIHFKELGRYGIAGHDLYDPCKSIYVAGWLLGKKVKKHGNTWTAVGAYHSETPSRRDAYAAKVRSAVSKCKISIKKANHTVCFLLLRPIHFFLAYFLNSAITSAM
jgi:soluble lytic murein transglycosylase-like protein